MSLDLSWNNLSISRGTFDYLHYLQILHLDNNPLFELAVGSLQNTTQLQYLNLSSTALSRLMIGSFGKLGKLRILDLSNNGRLFTTYSN